VAVCIVSPATRRRADQLLQHAERWARGTRKSDGLAFVTFTSSSKSGGLYFASVAGCSCPGYLHRGVCCHQLAVAEDADRRARQVASVIHERTRPTPRLTYEDLVPACAGGCGDVVERRGERCYRCLSDETRRLELATRHAVR